MSEWNPTLVSVIMPAYNCRALLSESVRSVVAQEYHNWELLIVDDASHDQTLAIARDLARGEDRIRIIPLAHNGGVANARNAGIAAARGRYIAFLDSDDLWLPEKLAVQLDFMRCTGVAFTFARYRRIRSDGTLGNPVSAPAAVNYEQLLRGNVIGCLTVLIDREQIPDISMPPIKHEDYVAWLAILKRGHIAYGIQKDVARYRVASSSVSGDKKRSAGWTWNVYRNVERLSLAKSAWCFANYFARAVSVRYRSR